MKEEFTRIYSENAWGGYESRSGTGSSLAHTKDLIPQLQALYEELNIKKILDIPCGDFNWIKNIEMTPDTEYIGADIVEELIEDNNKKYSQNDIGKTKINFKHKDITKDDLPDSDLIIVRDCFVHLTFDQILEAFENLKRTTYKYILTTSFVNQANNNDISYAGDWRPVNLTKIPFNLKQPIKTLNENCTELSGKFTDKSMCLWDKDNFIKGDADFRDHCVKIF